MKHALLLLLIGGLGTAPLTARPTEPPRIGQPMPEMEFKQILNFPRSQARLSDFRGKVVLLEFWGTWCAPCIQCIPHLQALQDEFREELVVLTVADEPEERLQKFLQKRPTTLPIVLDPERKLFGVVQAASVPHTILIDATGTVRAITFPDSLTSTTLRQFLRTQTIQAYEKPARRKFDLAKPLSGDGNVLAQITLTPHQDGVPGMSNARGMGEYLGRRIVATNVGLQTLHEIAHQFPASRRTVLEVPDPKRYAYRESETYCLDVILPEGRGAERFGVMQDFLNRTFELRARVERRPMKVQLLVLDSTTTARPPIAKGTAESVSWSGRGIDCQAVTLEPLVDFLGNGLRKIIVDETGLSGRYDLTFAWYHEAPERVHDELRHLGLKLIDAERDVDLLILSETKSLPK